MKTTTNDSNESIWTTIGVFFGTYFRCPSCKFAHEKHEIRKKQIKRKFKKDSILFGETVRETIDISIVSDHTYKCPSCSHKWVEQHEEYITEYEEDLNK